jgi:hypothetical protein
MEDLGGVVQIRQKLLKHAATLVRALRNPILLKDRSPQYIRA